MDVGKFEYLLKTNQRMSELLVEKNYQVCCREYPGGHNHTSWRDDLWRGLEYLLPAQGSTGSNNSINEEFLI
jgi:enterochelin esterase family protein